MKTIDTLKVVEVETFDRVPVMGIPSVLRTDNNNVVNGEYCLVNLNSFNKNQVTTLIKTNGYEYRGNWRNVARYNTELIYRHFIITSKPIWKLETRALLLSLVRNKNFNKFKDEIIKCGVIPAYAFNCLISSRNIE